jgi:predicted extracellular nuclease
MALNTGGLAFVGFNADGADGFAVVALTDIAAGEVIIFTDNEWSGSAFNTGEGVLTWTVASAIAAGTVINFAATSTASPTVAVGAGAATTAGLSMAGSINLGASAEVLYVVQGTTTGSGATTTVIPDTFLTAIANGSGSNDGFSAANGQLPSSLALGINAIDLSAMDGGADIAAFNGTRAGAADFASYRGAINNATNWVSQDATGNQDADGVAPDAPFDATAFSISGSGPATTIAISPITLAQAEGDSGTTAFSFTVSRSSTASDTAATVTITGGTGFNAADIASVTVDGTPVAGFALGAGFSVPLTGSASSASIVVNIAGDTIPEGSESFTVALSNPTNGATLGTSSATATVQNDDVVITRIHDIQGTGAASPISGNTVTIRAVVTADFQNGTSAAPLRNLDGFFVQELMADQDANPLTSEGIFVFQGTGNLSGANVNVGDIVEITGTVSEFSGETQIGSVTNITVVEAGALSASQVAGMATDVSLGVTDLESVEGMLVRLTDTFTVTETFNLDRFGEFRAVVGDRPYQYTQLNTPTDAAAYNAYIAAVNARSLVFDDARAQQNPDPINVLGNPLTAGSTFSHGDTFANAVGIMDYGNGSFRLQPTQATAVANTNPRDETAPDLGVPLTIASFNVLNFFTTPNGRGANDRAAGSGNPLPVVANDEFQRQADKLIGTLAEMDADVVGLVELENLFAEAGNPNAVTAAGGQTAIQYIVTALNARFGAGTYDWVRPGANTLGGDQIAVGLIFKPSKVTLKGVASLDDADLAGLGLGGLLGSDGLGVFEGANTSRVPLTATFEDTASGESFTVSVNHFKSKSGAGTGADADSGNGAGAWNNQRLEAATALAAWLATNPTGDTSGRNLIIGDLNAYARENPISYLLGLGYTDLAQALIGPDAYSYVFDGYIGTLDYGLASAGFSEFFTAAADWHINSDEADAFDYNQDFRTQALRDLFDPTSRIRTSDHDPFLMGLDLTTNFARFSSDSFTGVRELSSRSFDTVEGSASAGDAIDVLREAALGDIGTRAIDVNDLTIRADGAAFLARFSLAGAATQLTLAGTAAMAAVGQEATDDSIGGNDGANFLDGLGGADTLLGGGGADTLLAGLGDDVGEGGDGNDIVLGWFGADELFGNDGNDFLHGEQDDDRLLGGTGNDTLFGGDGADTLDADDGVDFLDGFAGSDILFGGLGNDVLFGFSFNQAGDAGADTLDGGDGDDTLIGGLGSDVLTGGGGADDFYWADFEVQNGDADVITDWDAADQYFLYAFADYTVTQLAGSALITLTFSDGSASIVIGGATASAVQGQIALF